MLASGAGRLRLEACWTHVNTDGGFSGTTSEMRIHYRLLDADGQVRFEREITGSQRVALSDVPLARVRAAQSLQAAIRNNVGELLNALVAHDRQNPGAFAPVVAPSGAARRNTST